MDILKLNYIFTIVVISVILGFFIFKKIKRSYFLETLKLRLLLIKLPQITEKNDRVLDEINLTSQFLSELGNLKIPFALEAAVSHIGEEIHFYVAVPKDSIQFVARQIQSLWPEASAEETEDYNIFNHQGASEGVFLKQKENPVLPIRTYEESGLDTFSPILNNLSGLQETGEGAALQIMVRPAPKSFKKLMANFIYQLKNGAKLEEFLTSAKITFKDFLQALNGEKIKKTEIKPIVEEELIKAAEKKLAKPIFSINVRLIVSTSNQLKTDELLYGLASSFNQFEAPKRNMIKATKPRNKKVLFFNYIFRQFNNREEILLGTDELVSIFHFPISSTVIPKIKWLRSKEAPPPVALSKTGTLIGDNVFQGERKQIFISDEDRRRHVYTIGQTGTGKTNFMMNMALEDIRNGKGVAWIDPHGDSINDLLGLMPENRVNDIIVFDPGDVFRPIGMNMLEYDLTKPEQKTFIVNEMQGIFQKLFPESGEALGPVFQQYMRNTLLLLMEDAASTDKEPSTLMDVPRILTNPDFRNEKLTRCKNPVVKDFWEREVAGVKGEGSLENVAPYITSKFNNFIANDYIRPIISQPRSAFNFRKIMDEGKILLVNLSKGKIGDINANLLGMIIVGKILMAALSRVDIPSPEKRKDFNLYIDEFQNFTTDSIDIILSEARKYRLNLVIAHQFISQLPQKTRDAVFGNIGSMIIFRLGPEDAEQISKQFDPSIGKNDLINIENFNAYAKILINGQPSKPFNIQTFILPRGNAAYAAQLHNLALEKYSLKISSK